MQQYNNAVSCRPFQHVQIFFNCVCPGIPCIGKYSSPWGGIQADVIWGENLKRKKEKGGKIREKGRKGKKREETGKEKEKWEVKGLNYCKIWKF